MLKTLPALLFLFLSFAAFGQNTAEYIVIRDQNQYLQYGDYTYVNSFRGLRQLMNELPSFDPELAAILAPEFQALQQRQTGAQLCLIGGTVIGSALMITSINKADKAAFSQLQSTGSLSSGNGANNGGLILGAAVALAGLVTAGILQVGEPEILGFINSFNRNSRGEKLRLSIGMELAPGSTGIGLSLKF